MNYILRIFLLTGSVITFVFISRYIKKSRVRIEDTMFWVIFAAVLVVIGVFPDIPLCISRFLKIESPANFVFLRIIFVLLINRFFMSMKISRLEIKLRELTQYIAINDSDKQ